MLFMLYSPVRSKCCGWALIYFFAVTSFVTYDSYLYIRDHSSKIGRWLVNQHQRRLQELGCSRQARELISGPNRGTRAKFLSLSREQSRVVTGILTRHSTLCRHLHLMGLRDSPLCRKCGAQDKTSAHIFFRCEALASIRHAHLGSFFLEPEDIKHQNLRAIWCFSKAAGLL
jgi:hypothetical protein